MRIDFSLSQSGLKAQQVKMDQLSNDISNVNTTGYKQKATSFRELLMNDVTEADVLLSGNNGAIGQSRGVQSAVTGTKFSQGNMEETGQSFNLAIAGNGFFQVNGPNGQPLLTRDGNFQIDGPESGVGAQVVNSQGHALNMNLTVPLAQWPEGDISINPEGLIQVQSAQGMQTVGTVPLFMPENPQGLQPVGSNYFMVPEGEAVISSVANPEIFGTLHQGFIERSNVDLAQSMTEMIMAQRAYSLNAQVARSTDEMYQVINQFNG